MSSHTLILQITEAGHEFEEISREYFSAIEKLRTLLSAYTDFINDEQYRSICEEMDIEYDDFSDSETIPNIDITGWSQEKIDEYFDSCAIACNLELDVFQSIIADCDKWFELPDHFNETIGDGTFSIGDCAGLTPEMLEELGYDVVETTEGTSIYLLSTDKEVTMVNFDENLRISIVLSKKISSELRAVQRMAPLPEEFSRIFEAIGQARDLVNAIYGDFLKRLLLPENKLLEQIGSLQKYIDKCEMYLRMCNEGSPRWKHWNGVIKDAKKTLATTRLVLKYTKPLLRFFAYCIPIADYMATLNDCYDVSAKLAYIYTCIPNPCPDDQFNANLCIAEDIAILLTVGSIAITDVIAEVTSDIEIAGGTAASIATGGTSLAVTGWGIVKKVAVQLSKCCVNLFAQEVAIKHLQKKVDKLKCKEPEPPIPPIPPGGGSPNVKDPSGYVYEGVSSNRLEGVTATAFYKETIEDMYGDLHENIVKWDAEEYAQENPLFTDKNGMYAWDVPNGLWQVKFEKEGYETTYSEWLPVPPPQLDVNIPMKQNVQPNVKYARAFEEAVEFEFDKYMIPELLNLENIIVMADGNTVDGTIELLNEEESYEGSMVTFASKVRFNAAQPFESSEVTLMVSNRVESYAGIRMQDDFSQAFTVEREVRKIECDSVKKVAYGGQASLTVSVLPAAASAGKTLNVRSSSSVILSTNATSITINENGKANIDVSGELPGTAALTFTVDGYDISATTIVKVEQLSNLNVAAPTANIASGTEVEKGTEITLSCMTEGAVIYYTLDGSCPCDEDGTRILYDAPIVINDSVTIKAMATAQDMFDSEIAEFVYTVNGGDAVESISIDDQIHIYPLPVRDVLNISATGKTIKNVTITNPYGISIVSQDESSDKVSMNVSTIAPGIYIIVIQTNDGTYSYKILKSE